MLHKAQYVKKMESERRGGADKKKKKKKNDDCLKSVTARVLTRFSADLAW